MSLFSKVYEQGRSNVIFGKLGGGVDYSRVYITMTSEEVTKENDPSGEMYSVNFVDNAFKSNHLPIPQRIYTNKNYGELITDIKRKDPVVVININEYLRKRDAKQISMCSLLDLIKVSYTGADQFSFSLSSDKFTSKAVISGYGIPTAKSKEFHPGDKVSTEGLIFPLIVKPINEDGSTGISEKSIVNNKEELKERIQYIFDKVENNVMVEEFIKGREFEVSLLGSGSDLKVLPVCEVVLGEGNDIYSGKAKFDLDSEEHKKISNVCPAIIDQKISQELKELSKKAFKIFRCRDYARCDFRVSEDGKIYMLEVNVNPSLDDVRYGLKAEGISDWEFIDYIVREAYKRGKQKYTK